MQPLPVRREAEAALERAMLSLTDAPCKTPEQLRDMLSHLGLQARGPALACTRAPRAPLLSSHALQGSSNSARTSTVDAAGSPGTSFTTV